MTARSASPETVATRTAVSMAVDDLSTREDHGGLGRVMVACSGGPDSIALVAATGWVAERRRLAASALVIDHDLQAGSAQVADAAAETCGLLGVPAEVVRVQVSGPGGPEAAARAARYAALEEAAMATRADAVLLGHTREDQAETVLLRLTRGSGARSLAGMATSSGLWRRPFLHLERATVRAAAREALAPLGRTAWSDPHNEDPAFARVRVRRLLDDLGEALGPGVVRGLSRTADLLREDADALDAAAREAFDAVAVRRDGAWSADCGELAALPGAIRGRVLRAMALAAGTPGDDLDYDHVQRLRDFVDRWRGQGEARLPGGVVAERDCGRLWLRSPTPENGAPGGA